MRVCGIIAEYNPFHSGHAYHISEARKQSGCDYVIVVMSGDFVQRGTPALMDKYTRARAALLEGADLVLMLPVYGSTASAEGFARAGIAALKSTGIVDCISFGCEDSDLCSEQFVSLARGMYQESEQFSVALSEAMASGSSYARARMQAIRSCYGNIPSLELLEQPNNLLVFEYLRAEFFCDVDFKHVPVVRCGDYHGNANQHSGFLSASACRELLSENISKADLSKQISRLISLGHLPSISGVTLLDYANTYSFLTDDDMSGMLHYALLGCNTLSTTASTPSCETTSAKGFDRFLDCSKDLAARIQKQLPLYESYSGFCNQLKNKSVTHARVMRTLCHILLQLPAKMPAPLIHSDGTLPYLRVLGFRQSAAPLLHELKLHAKAPLITRIPQAQDILSPYDMLYMHQDLFASDLYRSMLLHKCRTCFANDYQRKVEVV